MDLAPSMGYFIIIEYQKSNTCRYHINEFRKNFQVYTNFGNHSGY